MSKCDDGKVSEDGVRCVNQCEYYAKENKCVQGPNSTLNCSNFVYTGTAFNFTCSPCPDDEISEDGKNAIKNVNMMKLRKNAYKTILYVQM